MHCSLPRQSCNDLAAVALECEKLGRSRTVMCLPAHKAHRARTDRTRDFGTHRFRWKLLQSTLHSLERRERRSVSQSPGLEPFR